MTNEEKMATDLKSIRKLLIVAGSVFALSLIVFLITTFAVAEPGSIRGISALVMFFSFIPTLISLIMTPAYSKRYKQALEQAEKQQSEPAVKAVPKAPVKRPKTTPVTKPQTGSGEQYYDDLSFVKDMKKIINGPWAQYDILIDARMYGWNTMVDWADYMAASDLSDIDEVTAGTMVETKKLSDEFKEKGSIKAMPSLKEETGLLSVAGTSRTLKLPVKIVWINQTSVLRIFTTKDDENLIRRYAETVVRRKFGTPDSMRLGKPHTKEN